MSSPVYLAAKKKQAEWVMSMLKFFINSLLFQAISRIFEGYRNYYRESSKHFPNLTRILNSLLTKLASIFQEFHKIFYLKFYFHDKLDNFSCLPSILNTMKIPFFFNQNNTALEIHNFLHN